LTAFRLVSLSGSLAGRVHVVDGEHEIVLGRDPNTAQVVFGPDDRQVSRRHASVRVQDGFLLLRDLDSSTGTFVDGQSVEEAELEPGDVFELGPGGPRLRVDADAGGTMLAVPRPAAFPAAPAAVFDEAPGEAPEPPIPPGSRLRLEVTRGTRAGESAEAGGRVVRLGRAPTNTVAFPAEAIVSAQHCKIVRLEDGFVLVDLESTNGTFVNGRPVRRARLKAGDLIELGPGGPELRVALFGRAESTGATVLIPNFADLASRRGEATLVEERELPDGGLLIGRGDGASLRLESPIVSQAHARLVWSPLETVLEDLGSSNGTYVNGTRVRRRAVGPGDDVVIGPFRLEIAGRRVAVRDTRRHAELVAEGLVVSAGDRRILDGVSLRLAPGTFTAIIGPSGSGKSTLLKALCGARPAAHGQVSVSGRDLYSRPETAAGLVGYVPQDDVVHAELTPAECLDYAARLRLPADTSTPERRRRVEAVLATLELSERARVPIRRLSGGQRKRVSIGTELVTDPDLLFLDEPTSGLDPGLEESLMLLLRELSFKGKTVAVVTHTLDHIGLCDALVLLAAGRVVFAGPPRDALRRFGIAHPTELYARLKERPAEEWTVGAERGASRAVAPPPRPAAAPGALRQLGVLVARYLRILGRDGRNAALLLAQAPLIAGLIGLSLQYGAGDLGYTKPKNTLLFLLGLTAVWFGCSNAARELVKERALWARERLAGLRPLPYVASKLVVLTGLAVMQCAALLTILHAWFGIPGFGAPLLLAMVLAAAVGTLLGLVVSALATTADRAMTVLPIVLIPQVLFTFPAVQLDMRGPAGVVARAMPTWWSFDALRRLALRADEGESDDALDARLQSGRPALMTKARFERMLQDGYSMWNYRSRVEITWTASGPERWGAALPARLGHWRPLAVDLGALAAIGVGLFAAAVGKEWRRRE
jgi:ABC-type multidrug transport system ATPase subunit/pSer/pThr/pTyr-binding forkhead associated (FHA) protein